MTDKTFNFKGGVLIIGSLLWQDYLNKLGDDIRKTWRAKHLLTDNKIMVSAPIRYGRYSGNSNSKIYTITFSKTVSKKKFGTGYFVPFSKPYITTKAELLNEATALSEAEGMKGDFVGKWGTLGILFNDTKINKLLKADLTAFWKSKVVEKNKFNSSSYKVSDREIPSIKANGLLNFSWIKPVDSRQKELLNSYDFILATATLPTEYPKLKKLSENVQADKSRFYFVENYKSGITTFQDIAIINSL